MTDARTRRAEAMAETIRAEMAMESVMRGAWWLFAWAVLGFCAGLLIGLYKSGWTP